MWINYSISLPNIVELLSPNSKFSYYIEQIIINSYGKIRKVVFSDIPLLPNESPRHLTLTDMKLRSPKETKFVL